jgi:hypothetical protein
MSALLVVLLGVAAWTGLSVLTAVGLMPLLRAAARADLAARPERSELAPPPPERFSPLRDSGYRGIVLERLVLHASTIFGADQVCVFGRDMRARDDGLVLVQGAGVNPDLIGRPLDVDWDPMVAALACGRPLTVPGHLWPAWDADDDAHAAVTSAAIAPVWFGGRVGGAVSVAYRRDGGGLDVRGLSMLGELAELVGQALAHTVGRQLSAADPQVEIDGLLVALARACPGWGSLGPEVAWVAHRLAEDIGLSGADLLELELAARLQGIGRLRMPPVVRAGMELMPADIELLRLEPLWGAEIVARIPGLEAVALIVRHSRERWDGRGHPDGLHGERIPLASRIVAIAEGFCSLTAHELAALTPTHFDPDLAVRLAGISGDETRPGVASQAPGAALRHTRRV